MQIDAASGEPLLAGDAQCERDALARRTIIAQKHDRILPFVVENEVKDAIVVEIDKRDRLRVEDLLRQTDRFSRVLEGAIAQVAIVAIAAFQTADNEIKMAIVIDITPRGASCPEVRLGESAAPGRHVGEAALAIVLEQLEPVLLRHEQVGMTVVVEVAKGGIDLARREGNTGVFRQNEDRLFLLVLARQDEQPGASSVEEIRSAVAVHIT